MFFVFLILQQLDGSSYTITVCIEFYLYTVCIVSKTIRIFLLDVICQSQKPFRKFTLIATA